MVAQAAATAENAVAATDSRLLRVALVLQVVLGLLWGISMVFFARQIVLGDASGAHIEKIAMEGGGHFALVFGAILVWRAPDVRSRFALLIMVFLNAVWALTDLVYIPLYSLGAVDFTVKLIVNAALAILLYLGGRRARLI